MLLNIPGSSLILSSRLMLSCFLCATPSDPYFPSLNASSQSLYRDGPFLHPLYPRCQLHKYFPPPPYNWCQAPELTWRGGSHDRCCEQRSQQLLVLLVLPYVVVPAFSTQQWSMSPCPSWHHSQGHSPSTGCSCAHWTIRGPSKSGLIWCLQLSFA